MIKVLFAILFSIQNHNKVALFTTDKFDSQMIAGIKRSAKNIYRINLDSVCQFNKPPVYEGLQFTEARCFIDSIVKIKSDYAYRMGLTSEKIGRLAVAGNIDFGSLSLYGTTIDNACIVSSAMDLDMPQTVSTAMHELGHMLGLSHCQNDNCLMVAYGGNDNQKLCKRCKRKYLKTMK